MDAEETAFVAAICRDPGDDEPRMQFADWLDEHGRGEYAEFVRVQVKLARDMPAKHRDRCNCKGCQLRARERKLWDTAAGWWPVRLPFRPSQYTIRPDVYSQINPDLKGWGGLAALVTRGFVSHVTCAAADWLAHHEALFWHPEQTAECPACRGEGYDPEIDWPASNGCVRCYDEAATISTGRAPRPCPPTAQPISQITLTDLGDDPDGFCLDNEFSATHRDGTSVWTSPKWEGVEFAFPQHAPYFAS